MSDPLGELAALLPCGAVRTDPQSLASYGRDWVRLREPNASAVAFPSSTEDVVRIVGWARRHKTALVPSGGRTGLSGGALAERGEVVVSMERMNRLIEVSREDALLTAEAGATILSIQRAAKDLGLYYPIDFAPSDTMQLGGNIATNAGGVHVIRYGMTRAWVAGLEVVCANGLGESAQVLDLSRSVLKNNTGYDLKQLFIGSEGTLGLITRATVRLAKPPRPTTVGLLAVQRTTDLIPVALEAYRHGEVLALEFWDEAGMALATRHLREKSPAVAGRWPAPVTAARTDVRWYVLAEIEHRGDGGATGWAAACDGHGWGHPLAVLPGDQAEPLWAIRLSIGTAVAPFTPYKNDISVPLSRLSRFLPELQARLGHRQRMVVWGHLLDGNLHVNCLKPDGMSPAAFAEDCKRLDDDLYGLVADHGGSISAEHGIGLLKKHALHFSRSEAEVSAMRAIKRTFDPDGILNPGKVFDV